MELNKYGIVYDEKYYKPGYIVYEKEFKKYFKIMPITTLAATNFMILAADENSDETAKKNNLPFREIIFDIDEESSIYNSVRRLYEEIRAQPIYSKSRIEEGYNSLRIQQSNNLLHMVIAKDLTHNKNLQTNSTILTASSIALANFYNYLSKTNCKTDEGIVFQKIINLKATK